MYDMTDVEIKPNHPRYELVLLFRSFDADLIFGTASKSKVSKRVAPA